MLLPLAETARLGENGGRALRAESASGWPKLHIDVELKMEKYGGIVYTMLAEPVVSEDGTTVRYNSYARFDQRYEGRYMSGFDPSIISYRQTDGFVTVVDTANKTEPSVCLDSESGPYPIVPINAIAQRLMDIRIEDAVEVPGCSAQFRLADSNIACKGSDGASFTILGGDMNLKVTYNPNEEVSGNGGSQSACTEVVKPVSVQETHGKTFLKP